MNRNVLELDVFIGVLRIIFLVGLRHVDRAHRQVYNGFQGISAIGDVGTAAVQANAMPSCRLIARLVV